MIRTHTGTRKTLLCSTTLLAVSFAAAPVSAQRYRVKLGTQAPHGTSMHRTLQALAEQWRQAPGGGVQLVIYPDGTMGSEADMVRRMRIGQLQAAMLTVSGLAEIDDGVSALQKMPLVYRTLEESEYVREQLRGDLEQRLLEKGFVVLFWGDAGWAHFFSKEPASTPEDFKKMKMFVGAGDTNQIEIMKALGFDVVPLEWSDALTALQTGMIDAVPTIPLHALAGQFYLTARHMLPVPYVPLVGATVVTRAAWEKMPAETRAALQQSAQEAGARITEANRRESREAIEAMRARGLTVHSLPPETLQLWIQFCESVYPQIRGRIVPAEMFDRARAAAQEYRAEVARRTP